jgi:hypothetical protein
MKELQVISIVIVSIIIGFIVGTPYGFYEGVENSTRFDTILIGNNSRQDLIYMERDGTNTLKSRMEGRIDNAIYDYDWFNHNVNKLMSYFFLTLQQGHH